MPAPSIEVRAADGGRVATLAGEWTLAAIGPQARLLRKRLEALAAEPALGWDLEAIDALDSVGAMLLWRAWGERFPDRLAVATERRASFERLRQAAAHLHPKPRLRLPWAWLEHIGRGVLAVRDSLLDVVALLGQLLLDALYLVRHPVDFPWREVSANIYKSGARALPVTSLVGFLIGVVLSYLSALQLRNFGADVFIVNILGLGIIRELGPVLVAVLVAGRSGSAMTAQLGVMRVTEEIDALATMGVSRTLRLVLPKVVALSISMPLIVLWTSAIALFGGALSAQVQLDLGVYFFFATLPKVVQVSNLWIGLAKGTVFGFLIALIACHFGLRVRPNTESLSANTTTSVVTGITIVILVDAVFAIATRSIGVG